MVSESRIEQHRLGHSQVGNRRGFRGIGRDQIGDAHDVDDATKEEALDHLENKLKKVLQSISDAKVPQVEEHAPVINEDELSTSEEEIAAIMDKVLARARAEDGWKIEEIVSEGRVVASNILDAHDIDDVTKEAALDHLESKLKIMLEKVLREKKSEVVEHALVIDKDGIFAAEEEVAAKMDEILERARVEDGWDIEDVVSKVDVGVSKILDANDQSMDEITSNINGLLFVASLWHLKSL